MTYAQAKLIAMTDRNTNWRAMRDAADILFAQLHPSNQDIASASGLASIALKLQYEEARTKAQS